MKRNVIVLIAAQPPRGPWHPLPLLMLIAVLTLVTGELSGQWQQVLVLAWAMCRTATAYYKAVVSKK